MEHSSEKTYFVYRWQTTQRWQLGTWQPSTAVESKKLTGYDAAVAERDRLNKEIDDEARRQKGYVKLLKGK